MEVPKKTISKYNFYRKIVRRMMFLSGLWPDYTGRKAILNKFFAFLSIFFCVTYTLSAVVMIIKSKNRAIMTRNFGVLLSAISVILRIIVVMGQQSKVQKLNRGLSDHFHRNMQNPTYRHFLFINFNMYYYIFLAFEGVIIVHFILLGYKPMKRTFHGHYTKILNFATPFDNAGTIGHVATFIYDASFMFYVSVSTSAVDMSIAYYCLQYVGELIILKEKLKLLLSNKRNYRNDLKEIVDRHNELIELHNILQEVYGLVVLWVAVTSAINLCIAIYQTSQLTSLSPIIIAVWATWCGIKITQSFSYSYAGTNIIEENEKFLEAVYDVPWTKDYDIGVRSNTYIMLMQKPLFFEAAGMMKLDFEIFAAVLKTAISYYCLLKTLDEKQEMNK